MGDFGGEWGGIVAKYSSRCGKAIPLGQTREIIGAARDAIARQRGPIYLVVTSQETRDSGKFAKAALAIAFALNIIYNFFY